MPVQITCLKIDLIKIDTYHQNILKIFSDGIGRLQHLRKRSLQSNLILLFRLAGLRQLALNADITIARRRAKRWHGTSRIAQVAIL